MKKKQIYVFRGKDPREWSESSALGPFPSEAKARLAIREDINESIDGCETLSPGRDEEWAEEYHIMEVVKSFQPVVTTKVSVSLGSPIKRESSSVTVSKRDLPIIEARLRGERNPCAIYV